MSTRKYFRGWIPAVTIPLCLLVLSALGTVWALAPKGQKTAGGKKAAPSGQKEDKKSTDAECEMKPEVRKQILAKVGSAKITVGGFADEINKKSPYLRARYESLERRKDLLKNMVRRELLAAEAERRGLDKDPDVQRSMKQVMIQKLLNKVFEERVKKQGIPEEELKAFYKEHFKEYNKPEQVRVSQIVFKTKADAEKVLAEAQKSGRNMRKWRQLVRKHSIDRATKVRGGDLRYFAEDSKKIAKPIVTASFKLKKPGEISGIVKTKKGFHILRLTHRRKAFKRTFEEVKKQIRQRILRRKRSEVIKKYVNELRNKAKVNINEGELKSLKVDTSTPIRRRGRRRRRRGGLRFKRGKGRRRRGAMRRRRRGKRRRRGMGRRRRRRRRRGGRRRRRGKKPVNTSR